MRTNVGTEVTLDTVVRIPYGNIHSDAALLVCGGTGRCGTVYVILESRYRQSISFLSAYLGLDVVYKVYNVLSSLGYNCVIQALVLAVLPGLRNLNLVSAGSTCIDSSPVLLNNILTLAAVGSLCGSLHQLDRLILGDNTGQGKECGLQDGVDPGGSHASLNTNLHAVDHVEVDVVVSNELLNLSGKVLLDALHIPRTVQKEGSSVNQLLNHVVLTDVSRIVAGNKICLVNQVGGLDGLMSETQVRHSHAAGLLGIVIKICLSIHIGVVADDLDGVLVGAYGTVRAKTPELTVGGSLGSGN